MHGPSRDAAARGSQPGSAAPPLPADLDDLRFVLQETRCLLVQQILAHETESLSVRELEYRNPNLDRSSILYHLRGLSDREIVERRTLPVGEQHRDLPSTFYAVTETGRALLDRVGLLDELDVWEAVYRQMERTEEIERIEAMERPGPAEG